MSVMACKGDLFLLTGQVQQRICTGSLHPREVAKGNDEGGRAGCSEQKERKGKTTSAHSNNKFSMNDK